MIAKYLLFAFLVFIVSFLLQFFIYQFYLLNKKALYARLIDMQNKNQNILVQTKVKMLKRIKKHTIQAILPDNKKITVIVTEPISDFKTQRFAYIDEKDQKYYSTSKKGLKEVEITPISENIKYLYKLKDRNYIFKKESPNLYLNEEQVLFKNPFTGEYFWEKEIENQECITEVELMEVIPKELDAYFFDTKEMQKILNYKEKSQTAYINIYFAISAILAIFTFFMSLFF